jgi:RiboL-PSP-HEPN
MPPERWPPLEVTRLRAGLDETARLVEHPEYDLDRHLEVHQSLCRFLVLRSCGYLERSTQEICRAYVRAKSGGPVRSFAHSWLERSGNPRPEYLEQLVARFDGAMGDEFRQFIEEADGRIKREIGALVGYRNLIAHGLSEGINRTKAIQYKDVVCEVTDWFILRFNPNR